MMPIAPDRSASERLDKQGGELARTCQALRDWSATFPRALLPFRQSKSVQVWKFTSTDQPPAGGPVSG